MLLMSVFASDAVSQTPGWGREGGWVIEALPSKPWDHRHQQVVVL